ncbi:hypothetical protein BDQ12DRAFT_665607 [Crucibulum laeve]|uniref:Uncharacterized protein n=1 Tax=Crucibulum laeve TaxID=68775 RepID=A0A5C3M1I1_9AGAR|nr:hypothetical protein BDQ12DRAFT_665607 [Crucibulum laeve]
MLILALVGFTPQAVIYWCVKGDISIYVEALEKILMLKGMSMEINDIFEDFHMLLKAYKAFEAECKEAEEILEDGVFVVRRDFREAAWVKELCYYTQWTKVSLNLHFSNGKGKPQYNKGL